MFATEESIFTLQRSSGRAPPTTEICRCCLVKRRWCPRALHPHSQTRCARWPSPKQRNAGRGSKACMRRLARTPLTQLGVVGAPLNLVSVEGQYSVDLAIYERLAVFYDHATVDTVQARVATMVTLEVYKFSAVADQETLEIILGCVCVYRLEVKTFLNDVTLRPAIDRFVCFFCTRGRDQEEGAARDHLEPSRTHRLQALDRGSHGAAVCENAQTRAHPSA